MLKKEGKFIPKGCHKETLKELITKDWSHIFIKSISL